MLPSIGWGTLEKEQSPCQTKKNAENSEMGPDLSAKRQDPHQLNLELRRVFPERCASFRTIAAETRFRL